MCVYDWSSPAEAEEQRSSHSAAAPIGAAQQQQQPAMQYCDQQASPSSKSFAWNRQQQWNATAARSSLSLLLHRVATSCRSRKCSRPAPLLLPVHFSFAREMGKRLPRACATCSQVVAVTRAAEAGKQERPSSAVTSCLHARDEREKEQGRDGREGQKEETDCESYWKDAAYAGTASRR